MAEKVEKETAETILLNHLVAQRIMKNLDTKSLLAASCMNKTWNRQARRVLRDGRKCFIFISGENPCLKATELDELLGSTSNPTQFNGIFVTINPHECDADLCQKPVDQVYGNLLQLPLKYLKVKWSSEGNTEKCPLGQFILRLMARSLSLEELDIQEVPMTLRLKPENEPTDGPCELSKLKVLQLPDSQLQELLRKSFLHILSSWAPQLEQLENEICPEWLDCLPGGKLHIITNLCIRPYENQLPIQEMLNDIWKICGSAPKLRKLSIIKFPLLDGDEFEVKSYLGAISVLILQSANFLQEITLDHLTATALRHLRDPYPLIPNVTAVNFVMRRGKNAGIGPSLLGTPWAKIFPNATSVGFSTEPVVLTHGIDPQVETDASDTNFTWPAIEAVDLGDLYFDEQNVKEIGILFPNLRVVTASVSYEAVPFEQIWTSWPNLQRLRLDGKLRISLNGNCDDVFCGIHPDEAKILQDKDEEYLAAVNIVPAFPAIYHLQGLKSLEIQLETYAVSPNQENILPPGKTFLPNVTALIGLRSMPDLVFKVTAPIESAKHLDHLKAFVNLEYLPPNPSGAVESEDGELWEFMNNHPLLQSIRNEFFPNMNPPFGQGYDPDLLEMLDIFGRL